MARGGNGVVNGAVAGLFIVLIVVAIWFFLQFQGFTNPLTSILDAISTAIQSLADSIASRFNSAGNLLTAGTPDTPVSTVGSGGGPGDVFGPQIITGAKSSDNAYLFPEYDNWGNPLNG